MTAAAPLRLFSSSSRAWTAVGIYIFLLYSTQNLVLQLYLWVFNQVGEGWVSAGLITLFILAAAALLAYARPRQPGSYVTLGLVAAGMAYAAHVMQQPANWIHFVQYPPLTLLVFNALRFSCRSRHVFVWTFFVVSVIGLGDEIIQTFMGRRFDIHDLALNGAAALFALAIIGFVLPQEGERSRP